MLDKHHLKTSSVASIIQKAQQQLLSPDKFYGLCQKTSQQLGNQRLYFYKPASTLLDLKNGIGTKELLIFLDYLSRYLTSEIVLNEITTIFYIKKIWLKTDLQVKKALLISRNKIYPNILKNSTPIEVEIAGSGMIGRVARIKINQGKDLAFKAFFDPEFVWQHGPWAEIPVGIRLKYRQVTKNIPEFLFASQYWAVWEWIYPHTTPESRSGGITYEELAAEEGLTRLNPLNLSNYNPHNIRLDPGGIQKEYFGRHFYDTIKSIIFYIRKTRREGLKSLTPYLNKKMMGYILLRLVALINRKVTEKNY
ncbi:MAG TPA: hypothetical protein DEG17_01790 [Cyanobacteria bacterium UBA11149]|nr:hypothetical protein [Cyanobacteria bacterium UBA11367]HBE58792.1 hypothetical protein [Cyanobacteria bacterium UBA11366]HBR77140.1 hypothetical protein [Cyanobacteria bacterium UBA11159]HBS67628.1 hypothetical protein [Cyanobacteria bacterium UBA11153]HBW87642.1 hypothetical protein [Cyanobacteria bacterium UBA11149]HCA96698.1 hypothetical protein [Cyanobacteria bacterium UBA9226]